MTKKKIALTVLAAILLIGIGIGLGVGLATCFYNYATPKNITIKIVCREVVDGVVVGPILDEWIFTPDISRMYTEREFDGKRYKYFFYEYSLSDNPDSWRSLDELGDIDFRSGLLNADGKSSNKDFQIYEKGLFSLYVDVFDSSSCFGREVHLYIVVK